MKSHHRAVIRAGSRLVLPAAILLAAGCASPLRENPEDELRHSIMQSARRELKAAEDFPNDVKLQRENRVQNLGVDAARIPELEAMAGPKAYQGYNVALGPSLVGTTQRTVSISLERVIKQVAAGNLNVQFARLAPAISEAQVVAAQAAFDWTFFHNFSWNDTDEPRTAPSIGGATVGVSNDQRQIVDLTTGVRKKLITGGQFTFQHEFKYTDVETRNLFTLPDPARETNLVVLLEQPLLRNFGSDVALAQVRLNKNSERDEIQSLKATLITNVNDAEEAYWNLVRSYDNLKILQRLYERGEAVRQTLAARLGIDVEPAQYADAVARVESRRSQILRAQNVLATASDKLKTLMNDPEFPIGSDILLLPADDPVDESIEFNLRDSLETAIVNRPEIQRALISIDNTSIRQIVANNALLPRLDLRAQTQISGIGNSTTSSYSELGNNNFVDWNAAINFELPIGNREAQAGVKQRRMEKSQAVIAYRNTVQGIVSEVNSSLRNVDTNYKLIEQTRAARLAAAENVRTIDVKEVTTAGMTPEFLNLKLNRQESLASAEQEEIQALTDYNIAIAKLFSSMGTSLRRNRINFDVPDVEPIKESNPLFPLWETRGTPPAPAPSKLPPPQGPITIKNPQTAPPQTPPPPQIPTVNPAAVPTGDNPTPDKPGSR